MNNRTLKDMLIDSLQLEKDLYEFCIECLNHIYGDDAPIAIKRFEDSFNFYDYNGCLQSLCCIGSQTKKQKERMEREVDEEEE